MPVAGKAIFAGPEQRYAPTEVYEFVEEGGDPLQSKRRMRTLQDLDIKDDPNPTVVPRGGGTNYPNM